MADNILSGIDSGISSNILLAKFISDNSIPLIILKSNVLKNYYLNQETLNHLLTLPPKMTTAADDGSGDLINLIWKFLVCNLFPFKLRH